MDFNEIKGALFEIITLKYVLMSGYELIDSSCYDRKRFHKKGRRTIEVKGRGEWHQIDIPVDLKYQPNFAYPIRLLGEAKCLNKEVDKAIIRHEIGKMKDIQENYFVKDKLTPKMRKMRRNEIFAIFSASGFNEPAERLAYAHGIQTISYKNNLITRNLLELTDLLSSYISGVSKRKQRQLIEDIFDYLILGEDIPQFIINRVDMKERLIKSFIPYFQGSAILGITSTGLAIHLISRSSFPYQVFSQKDSALCRIRSDDSDYWYLTIDGSENKYYFSMPETIKSDAIKIPGKTIYPNKTKEFETIYFETEVDGKVRKLQLKFDMQWFNHLWDEQ